MRDKRGWKILVLFILAGILTLAGCGHEEASGGVTDVTGALSLSENGDGGSTEAGETADGGTLTTGSGISEIMNASGSSEDAEKARKLTEQECAELQTFINDIGCYGFLLSVYEEPKDLDAEQVFYVGAGLELEALGDEERDAYLELTGDEEMVNVFRLGAQQASDYLQYRAGVAMDDLTHKPDWIYMEEFDAYYLSHGDEETNVCEFEVTDAAAQGDYYRVHYRVKRSAADLDGWHIPVYEAILKKNGDSYRFCSNRLWKERDLLLRSYRSIKLDSGDTVEMCAYKPDENSDPNADMTFSVIGDGDVQYNLPGMNEKNIRSDMIFEEVREADFGDYDGDGSKEFVAICKYKYSGENKGREDGLEARIYRFGEDGTLQPDLKLSEEVNKKVTVLSLSGIAHYLVNGSDRETYKNWKDAFMAEVGEADPDSYDRFALIYISDDKVPELLEMGKTPDKGAKIVFFRDGVMEETLISSEFSFLRKENLLYSKCGTDLLFTDSLYVYTGSGFEVYQSGTYGTMDAAVTAYTKEGKPDYSYIWEGSYVSEAGYMDALFFIFDRQRAVDSSKITMASAREFLKELKDQ